MKIAIFMTVLTIALGMPPALAANSEATRSVTIYHSPEIDLEEVDRQLLDQVGNGSTINFAAFILSDYKIMDSLRGAADRGAQDSHLSRSKRDLDATVQREASFRETVAHTRGRH